MLKFMRHKIKEESIWVYLLVLAAGALLTFILDNSLFPLAVYTSSLKLVVVVLSDLVITAACWVVYKKTVKTVLPVLRQRWRLISLLALALTLLLVSLLPGHLPYHPVQTRVEIKTHTPDLGLLHIYQVADTILFEWVDTGNFEFTGAWNHDPDHIIHQGNDVGSFTFEDLAYIRDFLAYKIVFVQAAEPASVEIDINGQASAVEIPAHPDPNEIAYYEVILRAPEGPSISRLWQTIITIYPWVTAAVLFGVLFVSIGMILAQASTNWTFVFQTALFTVLLYLCWMTLNYQNELFHPWSQHPAIPAAVLAVLVLLPMGILRLVHKQPKTVPFVLAAILLLGIGARVYWVLMVPTAQVSDFGRFHTWALQLASGEPNVAIDRYANFTRLLSLLYRVWPSAVAVEVLNILLGTATAASLYFLARLHGQEKAGLVAAFWMALYPPHISMTAIVNTDIPSVFLLVLSVLLLSRYLRDKNILFLVLSGASFALCFFLRGAMVIYFPVLVTGLLLEKQKLRTRLLSGGLLLAAVLVSAAALNTAFGRVQAPGLTIDESRYLIWPLVNGTNIEALGRNNNPDTEMVFSWAPQDVNRRGWQVIQERLLSDPLGFYGILDDKFEHLLANATYGANVAFLDETNEYQSFRTRWPYPTEDLREGFAQVSQSAYVLILLLGLVAALRVDQPTLRLWLPVLAVLLCVLGAYTFFEVQPRYARPVIPFLLLLAGMAFGRKSRKKVNE